MPDSTERTTLRDEATTRLVLDGLVQKEGDRLRATRRWHGAMARAAARLVAAKLDGDDLRVPIASALVEIYGPDLSDELFADMIEVLLPIEAIGVDAGEPGPLSNPRPAVR